MWVVRLGNADRDVGGRLLALLWPLLVGNVLQQFYNIASTMIVGRFLGERAFAALGIAGAVMNLYIFVLGGVCIGVSILLASLHGSGDGGTFRRGVFLAVSAGSALTLLLSALSLLTLGPLLRLMGTPAELEPLIVQYLRIVLCGLIVTFLYNLCAAVLRSVGDTRSALAFLVVAVFCSAGLTLGAVGLLGWGVAGAGWAMVASQFLSVLLCLGYIGRKKSFIVPRRGDLRYDGALLREMARYGFVSALHQSSLYIGRIFVQGAVNTLGTAGIAAYTAADRIEGIFNAVGSSGAEALSIYTAHRCGEGERDLARRGLVVALRFFTAFGLLAAILLYALAKPGVSLFLGGAGSAQVVGEGVSYLGTLALFYAVSFAANAFVGYFRGSGRINVPFVGTTIQITLRVVLSYLLISRLGLRVVAVATGTGWCAILVFQVLVYRLTGSWRQVVGRCPTPRKGTPSP